MHGYLTPPTCIFFFCWARFPLESAWWSRCLQEYLTLSYTAIICWARLPNKFASWYLPPLCITLLCWDLPVSKVHFWSYWLHGLGIWPLYVLLFSAEQDSSLKLLNGHTACRGIWLLLVFPLFVHQDFLLNLLDGRTARRIFDKWKMTFGGRWPLVEDDLQWKTTFGGR